MLLLLPYLLSLIGTKIVLFTEKSGQKWPDFCVFIRHFGPIVSMRHKLECGKGSGLLLLFEKGDVLHLPLDPRLALAHVRTGAQTGIAERIGERGGNEGTLKFLH